MISSIESTRRILEDTILSSGNRGKFGRKGAADHWRIELHDLGGRADENGEDTDDVALSDFLLENAMARQEFSRMVESEIHVLLGDPNGIIANSRPHPEVARRPSVKAAADRSFAAWWKYDRPAFVNMKGEMNGEGQ